MMALPFTSRMMPYTLWSKGRLLGHSDLDFAANAEEARMGWFHPTELGEQVMEIMTEPSRVVLEYEREMGRDTFRADLASAADRIESLELELRAADGSLVAVKDVGINDTDLLLAIASEREPEEEMDPVLQELADDFQAECRGLRFDEFGLASDLPWHRSTHPRYQILVFL